MQLGAAARELDWWQAVHEPWSCSVLKCHTVCSEPRAHPISSHNEPTSTSSQSIRVSRNNQRFKFVFAVAESTATDAPFSALLVQVTRGTVAVTEVRFVD